MSVILLAYYLAESAVDCDVTCSNLGNNLACSNMITTLDSVNVFESAMNASNYREKVNIKCRIDESSTKYSKIIEPVFSIDSGVCSGFKDVPRRINCTAEEQLNENQQRLCYCVDTGKIIYSILKLFCLY